MSLFRKRRPPTSARKLRQSALHVEMLEGRTLLTYFSVAQVPALYTLEQATASVHIRQNQGPVADVAVAAAAHPVGMGYQSGYFNSDGAEENALRIDTAPGPGQRPGQHVRIAFSYTWTAALQTNEGADMPPWESFITSSVSVTGGDINDTLFNDNLSTSFILSERDGWTDRLVIPMRVGDSVYVGVSLNGEAHAAEPHYQTWVDFQAEFVMQDAGKGTVPLRNGGAAIPELAAASLAADALFGRREDGVAWSARRTNPAGYPQTIEQRETAAPWSARWSAQDPSTSTPEVGMAGAPKENTRPVEERPVRTGRTTVSLLGPAAGGEQTEREIEIGFAWLGGGDRIPFGRGD